MTVGVNALYLIPGQVGGTEIYLRSLLEAMAQIDQANRYLVFTNRETGPDLVPNSRNFHDLPQRVQATSRPARILYEQVRLPGQAKLDVLFNPGFTAPLLTTIPQVTVFHDLQHKRRPEHFRWFDLPAWRFLLWGAAHRSRQLIAVSEATRRDLLHYYGKDATVIPHGVDQRFFEIGRQRAGAALEPILLCVSTLHPHKNHRRLLRVFARLRQSYPDLTLVLTGVRGFHTAPIEGEIRALQLESAVRLTGWIDRADLYDLFRRARVFVYPSTFEGFGMPVLEALAANIPAACSDIEPLKTIAGTAAHLFDPASEDQMLAALDRLMRNDLPPTPGPVQAAPYTWTHAARATLRVLEAAKG